MYSFKIFSNKMLRALVSIKIYRNIEGHYSEVHWEQLRSFSSFLLFQLLILICTPHFRIFIITNLNHYIFPLYIYITALSFGTTEAQLLTICQVLLSLVKYLFSINHFLRVTNESLVDFLVPLMMSVSYACFETFSLLVAWILQCS